jgi:cytochrome c peroxidase
MERLIHFFETVLATIRRRGHLVAIAMCGLIAPIPQPAMAQGDLPPVPDWAMSAHLQALRAEPDGIIGAESSPPTIPQSDAIKDAIGNVETYQPAGATTTTSNAFFQSLGTNGRSCFTCHEPQDGWGLSAADATARFKAEPVDPIFNVVDGATCSNDSVKTSAERRKAYALLLGRGLIRIFLPMPPSPQFEITSVDDPFHCTDLLSPTTGTVSVYRRPLPATNLSFESTLMSDGREPNLNSQATDATLIHAQSASAPSTEQLDEIVGFETGTFTAQSSNNKAGDLTTAPLSGGPLALSAQNFYTGINDPFGNDPNDPTGGSFDPEVFDIFKPWESLSGKGAANAMRESIGRGEILFNTFKFNIAGVAGLNDVLGQASIEGTCGTCHDTPNVGNRSIDGTMEIGTDQDNGFGNNLAELPLFHIACTSGPLAGTTYLTTDPGRALITGQCADIGKVKVLGLRGLASRAPYFHNGSAANTAMVVQFYLMRFPSLFLDSRQQQDLTNFLNAL